VENQPKKSNFGLYAFLLLILALFGNLYQWSANGKLKHEAFKSNLDYDELKKTNDFLKQDNLLKEKVLRDIGVRVSGNLGGDRWAECAYSPCQGFQKTYYLYDSANRTWVVVKK
jgi:hypothetical protein